MTIADPHEVYDEMAASYADSNPEQAARAGYEWPAVRDTLPELDGHRVLDIGCGSGHYSAWFAERGADVVGIDASDEMLAEARERHGDVATFIDGDLREPFPFDDGAFDIVVSQLTLDHVESWDPLVAEFARVLGDDGTVVFSVDHPFTTYFVIEHEPPDIGNAKAESADYYEVERYETDWGDVSMPMYRRSLREVLRPLFDGGFAVTDLREPRPQEVTENLEYFDDRTPRFMVVRARKL